MNIFSENLIMRAVEKTDAPLLLGLINDPETESSLGGWSFPVSEASQIDWIESASQRKDTLRCIIAEKSSQDDGVGTVILTDIDMKNGTAEIHIKLAVNGRNKGYGTEAVKALTAYAFNELRLNCIYARVNEGNDASQKMFAKCGFSKEGVLKERFYKNGKYIDVASFSLLNKEN